MKKDISDSPGILALLKQYRSIFQTPENLEHYSENDYEIAERKFLIWCLANRPVIDNLVQRKL